ncbi:hypothetical protein EJ06DRAFT_54176 [Trichodelitschia bisporula]|uniref:Uncharacterized protein n=1 Tax=Trichodelitschia bisporula TaxID=703511 RepID=A0A6G1HUS7_9PEZI|nr:hypothetical protein EJ06DRAFT_54176 [Trichodelitschia bisporula]
MSLHFPVDMHAPDYTCPECTAPRPSPPGAVMDPASTADHPLDDFVIDAYSDSDSETETGHMQLDLDDLPRPARAPSSRPLHVSVIDANANANADSDSDSDSEAETETLLVLGDLPRPARARPSRFPTTGRSSSSRRARRPDPIRPNGVSAPVWPRHRPVPASAPSTGLGTCRTPLNGLRRPARTPPSRIPTTRGSRFPSPSRRAVSLATMSRPIDDPADVAPNTSVSRQFELDVAAAAARGVDPGSIHDYGVAIAPIDASSEGGGREDTWSPAEEQGWGALHELFYEAELQIHADIRRIIPIAGLNDANRVSADARSTFPRYPTTHLALMIAELGQMGVELHDQAHRRLGELRRDVEAEILELEVSPAQMAVDTVAGLAEWRRDFLEEIIDSLRNETLG